MKVLHIIPSVSSVRGGTSRAALDMVLALRNVGVNAEIATTNDDGQAVLSVPLRKIIQHEQVPIIFFPRLSIRNESLREFNFSMSLTQWLWNNIEDYNLVHIHALFSYPSTVAMLIARMKKVPYIAIPHGLLCEWSLKQSRRKKKLFLKAIERSNLSHSHALHLTSTKEQEEVSELLLPTPSFVLPLGLNMPVTILNAKKRLRQLLGIKDNAPIILFMGRIHYKKGLDYLISALSDIKETPFHFVIAGNGNHNYEAEVDALIEASGIKDRIHRTGFVEGEQKDIILQGSNLFALTSHSENFGVAVLEALAAGLPVVLTTGVALADIVKKNKLGKVTALQTKEISVAISQLLADEKTIQLIGDRARQFISENYTWEKTAIDLSKDYQSIVEKQLLSQHA